MILCLICARGGSKGLPGKNLLKINNKSLLAHSISHAQSCKNINELILSTDCINIANKGKKYGAKIPFLRPEWEVWQHAITNFKLEKIKMIVILPTTAPLRNKIDIEKAIDIYNSNDCDGVISFTDSYRNPSFNIIRENNEKYAEKYFDMTTACYVINHNFVLKNNNMFEGKLKLNCVPKEISRYRH
ncbi:acylneuraminate cytidylyltransferase family protein [Pseudomonadota bacterium]|nr:acylneuraminate cytidylyltransferase family protein [Pseudomonadota bacterium]